MEPISEITAEHGPIRMMLRILEKICARIEKGEDIPKEHLIQAVMFIREFADKCHHGKEEKLLFPAMRENGIPEEIALIDILIEEHVTGRNFVRAMADAAEAGDLITFSEKAKEYVALLDPHIDKENQTLFPMARKSLADEKKSELEKGFLDVEKNVVGEGRHKELHEIVNKLKEIYQ